MGYANRLAHGSVETERTLGDRLRFRLGVHEGGEKATTALRRRETTEAQRGDCSSHDVDLPDSERRQSNLGT